VFIESENSLLSGFPLDVEIVSSDPAAIIYYTTDGATPTPLSNVYISPVVLPLDGEEFTLRAVAYADDDGYWIPSNILGYTWSFDNSVFFESRSEGLGGVAYIYPSGDNFAMWYDYLGNTAVFVDQDPDDIPQLFSEYDVAGDLIPDNEVHSDIADPEYTPSLKDDQNLPYLSALGYSYFNPYAAVISIDTTGQTEEPIVPIANGPFMTRRDTLKYYSGLDIGSGALDNFHSGQHVRTFYNIDTGVHVAYYFDSVDAKWIKSVSNVPFVSPGISPVNGYGRPLVFQWNLFGRFSTY
jgi:hypothetical protein